MHQVLDVIMYEYYNAILISEFTSIFNEETSVCKALPITILQQGVHA